MTTEYAVLGYIMLFRTDAMAQALQIMCEESWFEEPKCRIVWRCMEDRARDDQGVATHLIGGELAARGLLERVTLEDLSQMIGAADPTSMSFGQSLRELQRVFLTRKRANLWMEGKDASGDVEREKGTSDLIAGTFQQINPPKTLQQAAAELAAAMDGGALPDYGLRTGLSDVDRYLGTLQPGELIVVAARPGCGKSSLLRQIACDVAIDGRRVIMVSTEMGAAEIVKAAARQLSDVPFGQDVSAAERQQYKNAVLKLSTMANLKLIEARQLSHLIAKWNAYMQEEIPPALFLVDYLQQLDSGIRKGETQAAAVGRISSALKSFAKDNSVVVLAAAQLNRESAKEGEPQLYHLRDSGAIEQDADRVLMLKIQGDELAESRRCAIDVFQRKNRNGPMGKCTLTFDRWTTRFANHSTS